MKEKYEKLAAEVDMHYFSHSVTTLNTHILQLQCAVIHAYLSWMNFAFGFQF